MRQITLLLISIFILGSSTMLNAQDTAEKESAIKLDVGADLMSRYIWRGTQYGGNGASLQPEISLEWKGLTVGFWGAYSLNGFNSNQELDLFANYTFLDEKLTIGVTDYFFTNDNATEDPLNYKKDSTGHILEASLSFNGTEKIPFSLLVAMNVYGADAQKINSDPTSTDFNTSTGIQYSTYAELGYSTMVKDISLDVFAGVNLTTPAGADTTTAYIGETGFYGSKAGLVNIGFTISKEIPVTDKVSLPISASLILNPIDRNYYFIFGISL